MTCYKKTISTKKPRVKVINWSEEVDKVTGPFRRQIDDALKRFNEQFHKEIVSKRLTLKERRSLWANKYEPKLRKMYQRQNKLIDKLWLKYHLSLGDTKVRPGYKLIY